MFYIIQIYFKVQVCEPSSTKNFLYEIEHPIREAFRERKQWNLHLNNFGHLEDQEKRRLGGKNSERGQGEPYCEHSDSESVCRMKYRHGLSSPEDTCSVSTDMSTSTDMSDQSW